MCTTSITNDLKPDCNFPLISGVKERIIIISKENVLSITTDVVNDLLVTDITMKPGKKANYILGIRNSNTSDTQMTEGEYQNSFIHNVSCLVFETDFETDKQIQNLSNTNHSYYLIVEKRDEQKNGVRQFKMYGYPVGMICNSIQQTVNDTTNLGAWFLTFTNDTVANIPNVPVSIYAGTQPDTINLINDLLNSAPIPDTTYDLENSSSNIIGNGLITEYVNNVIPVIDTVIKTVDTDSGDVIDVYSAPSGEEYSVPVSSGWVRPFDWPSVPDPLLPNSLYYLIEHIPGTSQWIDINISRYTGANADYKMYIDEIFYQNIPNATNLYIEIAADIHGFLYKGRKWSWVRFEVNNIASISMYLNVSSSNPNRNKVCNVVEVINNIDGIYTLNYDDVGALYRVLKFGLLHFDCRGKLLSQGSNTFRSNMLQKISNMFKPYTSLAGTTLAPTFYSSLSYVPAEFDFSGWTNVSGFIYNSNPAKTFYGYNMSSVTNVNNAFYQCLNLLTLELDDLSAVINTLNSFSNLYACQRMILNGLRVSFSIQNAYALSKQAILELIASIADLSGSTSRSIKMTNVPNVDSDVIAAANNKNWNIVI